MRLGGNKVRRVVVEKKTVTYDDYNQPVESWDAASLPELDAGGVMYAERWDQGGREATDGQMVAYSDVRFKCRYIDGLNTRDYRLNVDGEIFDIETIKEVGRREGQIIMAESQDNQ